MRLHHLEVCGFGPFAGRETLDLESLGDAGLFLIAGPTGSGKTSLLDAVSLALFGDVPGGRPKTSLRSDHAEPGITTEVVLDFTQGGRRFRVRRTPQYDRPKRRGSGTTRQQASVVVDEHVSGGWVHRTSRLDEAGDLITSVLPMRPEQFYRVALLPQGDFASFLEAGPGERQDLLKRIFDIETFDDLEAWLRDERLRSSRTAESAAASLAHHLDALSLLLAEVEVPGSSERPWTELPQDELLAEVNDLERLLDERFTEALTVSAAAAAEATTARETCAAGERTSALQARGRAARDELDALDAAEEGNTAQARRLDAARRAVGALATLPGHRRAADALSSAVAAVDSLQHQAGDALAALDLDGLESWVSAVDAETEGLRSAAEVAERVGSLLGRRAQLGRQIQETRTSLTSEKEASDAARQRIGAAEESLARAQEAKVQHEVAKPALERLRSALDQRQALDLLEEGEIPLSLDAVRRAKDGELTARESLLDLRQRRLDGMAGELAAGLSPGTSCPVCGSPEHPHPAVTHDPVTPAQIASAETAFQARVATVQEHQARSERLQERAQGLRAGLADEPRSAAELVEAVESAARQLDALGDVVGRCAQDTEDLRLARAEHQQLVDTLTARQTLLARLETQLEEVSGSIGEANQIARLALAGHAARCACGMESSEGSEGDSPDLVLPSDASLQGLIERLVEARSGHDRRLSAARDLVEAQHTVRRCRESLEAATSELEAAIDEHAFGTLVDAQAAWLAPADLARLQEEVAATAAARAAAERVLDEADVAAAMQADVPDVDALRDREASASAAAKEAVAAETSARHFATRLRQLATAITAAVTDLSPLRERADAVAELADLVTGRGSGNPLGLSLTSYVLAARLERIVELANERLETMAGARYELRQDETRRDGRSKAGLGLKVLDRWTDEERSTSTLSGGESFMASLALALGLAEAVREEAGALELGTLFIDEGFGTLDDQSLEEVLTVLDGLRERGRSVGVISHVPELRHRISTQVVVTKAPSGSTVRICSAEPDVA